jgi:FdhD protein
MIVKNIIYNIGISITRILEVDMVEPYSIVSVEKFSHGNKDNTGEGVITEQSVSLTVNGKLWLTFMCTPINLEELAVGFLYNENVIASKDEIEDIYICEHKDNVDIWLNKSVEEPKNWRRTSGCTGGYTAAVLEEVAPVKSNGLVLAPEKILNLVRNMFQSQEVYRKTGGVHTSALADGEEIIFQLEDVGRHNTLDKIAGKILLDNITCFPRVILSTGRISSEMLQKAARLQTTILVSRTSPTSMSIELANKLGITLIGYARGHRFNVYTHPERVNFDGTT